jgi:hypothetical protein
MASWSKLDQFEGIFRGSIDVRPFQMPILVVQPQANSRYAVQRDGPSNQTHYAEKCEWGTFERWLLNPSTHSPRLNRQVTKQDKPKPTLV